MVTILLLAIVGVAAPVSSAEAQSTLLVCQNTASDPDGDGFGWEIFQASPSDITGKNFESCRVTSESKGPPAFTNLQTGAPVRLTRAYWNPNNDIAGRVLRCEPYSYNANAGVYEKSDPPLLGDKRLWWLKDTLYTHEQLFVEQPRINTMYQLAVESLENTNAAGDVRVEDPRWQSGMDGILPLWSVNNGIYYGVMPLRASPYVEIVSRGASAVNAVRVWGAATGNSQSYHECFSLSEEPFLPTGSADSPRDGLAALAQNRIVSLGSVVEGGSPVVNLQSGVEVEFSNVLWDYDSQIAGRNMRCHRQEWQWRDPTVYGAVDLDDSEAGWFHVFHPSNGSENLRVSSLSYTSRLSQWRTRTVNIADDVVERWFEPGSFTAWEQRVGNFRLWDPDTDQAYYQCDAQRLTSLIFSGTGYSFTSTGEELTPDENLQTVDNPSQTNTGDIGDANGGSESTAGTSGGSGASGGWYLLSLLWFMLLKRRELSPVNRR